jgi:predicted ABC-type ATPase
LGISLAADDEIRDLAIAFAKANKKSIARRLTDPAKYPADQNPVSVFMAGSPGAGKTESSIELLKKFPEKPILRLDPDDLRSEFPQYTGTNSHLFQAGVSILVDKIHDCVLDQSQSFLLDGTLSSYEIAHRNIKRSLDKKRTVQILYVYQEPHLAWEFVRAREAAEGRRIQIETFIDQYFGARDVVNRLKREYQSRIKVDLLIKNNDNSQRSYKAGVDQIDNHVPERYTRDDLQKLFKPA